MLKRTLLLAAAVAALTLPASAAPHGVKVGQLLCHVDSGWGYVIGSSKSLKCSYHPNHGMEDYYSGSISKLGVDIGYTSSGTLVWDVIAPTSDMRSGALEGDYGGVTAGATIAVGLGAHVLLGGFDKSIALQPVSFEANSGLDVAAGLGGLTLRHSEPPATVAEAPSSVTINRPMTTERTFLVTFDFDKTRLSQDARAMIHDAAREARRDRPMEVRVVGHADHVGSNDYNDTLSMRRAEVVRQALAQDGIDAKVVVDGRGYHDPLIPTDPGVRMRDNRRVVIAWREVRERQASR
ncbi:MAG: DUF992 domain-containing protein [Rhizomicrobium sp.]|nr:DUF992 domain-containing protein [Rhizomicrobium sp.]